MNLTLLSGPVAEPVSLEETKAWLRLDSSEEDQLLSALIVSARLTLEAFTRRFFVTQCWRMSLDAWPPATLRGKCIVLPLAPMRSIAAIRIYDASDVAETLAVGAYRAPAASERGRIVFRDPPEQPGRVAGGVEIDVLVGYGDAPSDTPEPLRRAILALVAHWHENRGDETEAAARLPALVAALARPYRRERLA